MSHANSPLMLQIALHYYATPCDHPYILNSTHREYAQLLVEAGLLRRSSGPALYESTEGLQVFVSDLLRVQFPILQWASQGMKAQ